MPEFVKVVVDAMGGDYAPTVPVKAAVDALNEKIHNSLFFRKNGRKLLTV